MPVAQPPILGLERLVEVDAHEGPVYVEDEQALYFTTLPKPGPLVSIKRLDLETLAITTLREEANGANGMTLAPDGRLLVCEQGTPASKARISAVDRVTGFAETVVDAHGDLPLNSPNDIVVSSDGAIWFTDPSYGHLQGFRPKPAQGDHVYRFDGGDLTVVDPSFDKPNGLAFSPNELTLYVGDSGANHEIGTFDRGRPHHIRAFDVVDRARLARSRIFATITPGFPDGIKVDSRGRVYSSSFAGVQIFSPEGELLDEIALPGAVNFAFGNSSLYITTDTAIWAARLSAEGA
jgi:gluconolactonase